jgi:hypothetical protein
LLSIYIDSKDLQSNFEVPAVCGSTYFWVSLYKLPTVIVVNPGCDEVKNHRRFLPRLKAWITKIPKP